MEKSKEINDRTKSQKGKRRKSIAQCVKTNERKKEYGNHIIQNIVNQKREMK
jgi:hypothetical protein